jgi:flagellar hook protein FlgE
MSINGALLSGVSGLLANSTALASISDNIANVNTVGYKRNQTDFQTIVTARTYGGQSGATGHYNAGGVLAQNRQRVNEQGLLQRSTSSTDLGIEGQGFFVTTEKAEGVTDADARLFTRAGAFTVDEFGYLRNGAGLYLQGWPVADDGTVAFDPSDLSRMESINLAQVGGAAEPTTRASINANLRSSQVSSTAAATYDPLNGMSAYDPTATPAAGVRPDFELQIPVSDTKGGKRTLTIGFLKMDPGADPAATANGWHAEIYVDPSELEVGADLAPGQLARGAVYFTPDGRLDTSRTTLFGTPYNADLAIGASGSAAPGPGEVKWADSLGIGAQTIALDIEDPTAGLTQFDSVSIAQAVNTNGTAFGDLTNVEIDEEGFVTAIFDNGVMRRIAQVGLATFANPDGLKALSGNAYRVSIDSGTHNLKPPGAGGAGLLSPGTLEASTVDLSTEFTGLITTQRAYSASSKIITTADEMLEELIRIKR